MKLDDFLKRAENLQLEEKGRTLPIMQIAIMFENMDRDWETKPRL